MKLQEKYSGLIFVSMILCLTVLIIMGSGLYLWFAVPNETALKINGKSGQISTDNLLGTVLQSTLEEDVE